MKAIFLNLIIFTSIFIGCNSSKRKVIDKQEIDKSESSLYRPIKHRLLEIYQDDQNPDQDTKTQLINAYFDLKYVEEIIDKYGWLGPDDIGYEGNSALFLVIQHSDLDTQVKYLPMMTKAVINCKAKGSQWALLVDRVKLGQTGKQIYGSQFYTDPKTGKISMSPIIDEINVNKRRAKVGLGPIEDYAKEWGIDYKRPAK
ncbi:MAG: DUF6624 domain-containing protein [Bacteroidia bacterium]